MIIAVDGPSAAGKGTLARALAKHFKLHFLDTGSLYRMVGLRVMRGLDDPVTVARSLNPAEFSDADLRSEEVAQAASKVASILAVRMALLKFQRSFSEKKPGAVLDGRDVGTVICPHADFKFFVTASLQARAERRHQELRHTGVDLAAIRDELRARDERDSLQSKPADDAIMIDTSELTAEEVLSEVIKIVDGSK